MDLRFEKYEGLGNDFLVVDEPAAVAALGPADAARLCDRHLGVGADGVLCTGVRDGRPFMRVLNADGSVPEMCGNGVRCVALHLHATGRVTTEPFELDTGAGPHRVQVHVPGPNGLVEVGMVAPSFDPARIPLRSSQPWIEEAITVLDHQMRVTAVSMGNPHAVTFDDLREAAPRLGPALELDERFPQRVNVGFARMSEAGIDLRVWERGVGWTQACGTGACAAAAAAVATGRAERGEDLEVRLPGGVLVIRVHGEGEPVSMKGPARHVFSGSVPLRTASR